MRCDAIAIKLPLRLDSLLLLEFGKFFSFLDLFKMEENMVGYRFRPTDEELINHYLKNKILGKTWLVEDAISEININSYDPISFQCLSKIKSDDPVWYFFAPKLYKSGNKNARKRSSKSGYWKPTGGDKEIKDKRGNKIGLKKTLVYHDRGARTSVKNLWVMYEYQIKSLSLPLPNQESYVICKIKYKGEEISYGCNSSELNQSLVSDSNTVRSIISIPPPEFELPFEEENFEDLSMNVLLNPLNEPKDLSLWDFSDPNMFNNNNSNSSTPYLAQDYEENWSPFQQSEDFFLDIEFIMQENCIDYKPEKSLSGIIVDYYSDCDAESISATSYKGISSPGDSIGCSSTDSCKDLQTF